MKKLITFATAASLVMGSMAVPVYGAAFADINTVTWDGFKPFIEQAAELGLMSGYNENGKKYCKPRNNVTYCEAVQLMYSIMKVYKGQDVSDTTVTKWKPVISAYNIPDWAYKATAYALENEILTTSDLNKLQGNANKINTKAATREDVGVIFGKALDTVNGYDTKSNAALTYKDKSKVSAAAVPYLELLNRANLMVGDTDNNFNPKANISRAEMAVLSVKTYEKLTDSAKDAAKEKTVTATVVNSMLMANNDLFLTVKTKDGATLSLFANHNDVKPTYIGMRIGFDDIGQDDMVKLTYKGDQIKALDVTDSVSGIFTIVTYEVKDITSSKIKIQDGTKEKEYRLDNGVTVRLEGRDSKVNKLKDALEDAKYDAQMVLDREDYVLHIDAMLNDKNPTEGYVDDLENDSITLLVGARTYTYPLSDDLEITYNGKDVRFSLFEDEYADFNYFISVELNKDYEVDEIEVVSMEDEYNGTLQRLTSKLIQFTAGSKTYEYSLDDSVSVKVDGKKSSVDALKSAYREDDNVYTVNVTLNRSDKVTEIIATSRYGQNGSGELKAIGSDTVTITINGKEYVYDLARSEDVDFNGYGADLTELKHYMSSYTFNVDLLFNNSGEVSEIVADMEAAAEGELNYIDVANNVMSVRAAGASVKLELASNATATLSGEDIGLAALDNKLYSAHGSVMFVELEYNNSGQVRKITANWEDVYGELISAYDDDDEIVVKVDGSNKTYTVDRDAEFEYRLSSNVDEEDYASRYDSDLDGLDNFVKDCKDARNTCKVALTLEGGDVVRVKATAE